MRIVLVDLGIAVLLHVLVGCGPGQKWITMTNEPSGLELRTRYVTSAKSVKIEVKDTALTLYMMLSSGLTRVNRSKLGVQAKQFDFGELVKSKYERWVDRLSLKAGAASKSCEPTEASVEITREPEGKITARFEQDKGGNIYISMKLASVESTNMSDSSDSAGLVGIKTKPADGEARCISSWIGKEGLLEVSRFLLTLRDKYMQSLSSMDVGDVYQIGTKLKRDQPPTNLNVDQASKKASN